MPHDCCTAIRSLPLNSVPCRALNNLADAVSQNFFDRFFPQNKKNEKFLLFFDNKTDQSVIILIVTIAANAVLRSKIKTKERKVMKKLLIGLAGAAVMFTAIPEAAAGPHHHRGHHHRGNDGLRLAAGIVHLVKEVVAPAPVVVAPAPVVVAPRVVYHRPLPPRHHHRPAPPRRHRR